MKEEKALHRLRHGDTEALRWVIGRYGGYEPGEYLPISTWRICSSLRTDSN